MHVQCIGDRRNFIDAALLNIGEEKLWGLAVVLQKKYADTVKYTGEYLMC